MRRVGLLQGGGKSSPSSWRGYKAISTPANEVLALMLDQNFVDKLEDAILKNEAPAEKARKMIEREFRPKFAEYNRRIKSEKRSWWTKMLAGFTKIDAGFTSPKFYAQLAEAVLGSIGNDADYRTKHATNEELSYRF